MIFIVTFPPLFSKLIAFRNIFKIMNLPAASYGVLDPKIE
jgi:hypothetical protein